MASQIRFCAMSWREVAQSGVLAVADAVLDAGVAAVPQFQISELPTGGVGEETGDPHPVVVGDP